MYLIQTSVILFQVPHVTRLDSSHIDSLTAFRSVLRGRSGSDLPSSEAGQRNREAGRGRARRAGSARGGAGLRGVGAGALARAARLGPHRARRRAAARLL